ncbi:MAG: lytic transglycosylase domain-containing protein [Gemmatimonadales bacterium]
MRPLSRLFERVGRRALIPLAAVFGGLWVVALGTDYTHYLKSSVHLVAVAPAPRPTTAELEALPHTTSTADTSHSVVAANTDSATVMLAFTDPGSTQPRVEGWVKKLSTSFRDDFQQSIDRMGKYTGMITDKLDARGMPHDLIYLAMIESRFEPTARSHASAVGLWQFMASTARRFGLEVGRGVDQRKNPAASTDAALSYLSSLYHRFGSWYLAAAAYNSGEGTVQRALKKVTGRTTGTDADFFKILPVLPKETRDYVPKLIATATIASDPESYGLSAPAASVAH